MGKRFHSTVILVVVFALGLAAGVAGMVWAWPGLRNRLRPHHHQSFVQYLERTLNLSSEQVPRVEAVVKDTRQRRHELHLQFVPQYTTLCESFLTVSQKERAIFAPTLQQELGKLQVILTPAQWRKFQAQRAAAAKKYPPRKPDLCRHLPAMPTKPAATPKSK